MKWIGLIGFIIAQTTPSRFTKNKRAQSYYEAAIRAVTFRQVATAESLVTLAVRIDPKFVEAHILRAKILSERKAWERLHNAALALCRLEKTDPEAAALGYFFRMKSFFHQTNYDSAAWALSKLEKLPTTLFSPTLQTELEALERHIPFAREAVRNPVPFDPIPLGEAVNSPHDEYLPSLSADEEILVFTRRGPENLGGYNPLRGGYDEDLWWSFRRGDVWQPAQNMGPPINTRDNEGASFFSADGQRVFLVLCNRPECKGSCDLFEARLEGTRWRDPEALASVNSPYWESHPCLSHDGKYLYFASNRPGGMGGVDLWVSEWQNGQWQTPKNLGPPINTPGDEYNPMLAADGNTLYFSSDYHPGMGQQDFFVSYRTDTGWSPPRNLGYPINTPESEQNLFISTSGQWAFVSLRRPEGRGGYDIYKVALPPAVRPQRTATYVKGIVQDAQTRKPLAATVVLVDLAKGDTIRQLRSNFATGQFLTSLPAGARYAAYVEAKNYLFYSEHFSLEKSDTTFFLTIYLRPVQKGNSVVLRNIFFDFDQATLRPESRVELEKVYRFLQQNPHIRIEIQGHTDSIGSESYNLRLSQQRAEAVRDYLVQRGIPSSRLVAKGYGESRPIADNSTSQGRSLNRRTEMVILP